MTKSTSESTAGAKSKSAAKKLAAAPQKRKHRRSESSANFHIYLFRILKQVHPDHGISKNAMSVMNSLLLDLLERISREAGALARANNVATLSSREIQCATRNVLRGELAKHAISEGVKAKTKASA
jgi:histone H2B